jgi:hypothetical protein
VDRGFAVEPPLLGMDRPDALLGAQSLHPVL